MPGGYGTCYHYASETGKNQMIVYLEVGIYKNGFLLFRASIQPIFLS